MHLRCSEHQDPLSRLPLSPALPFSPWLSQPVLLLPPWWGNRLGCAGRLPSKGELSQRKAQAYSKSVFPGSL